MKPSGPGVQSVHSRLRVTSLIALLTVTGAARLRPCWTQLSTWRGLQRQSRPLSLLSAQRAERRTRPLGMIAPSGTHTSSSPAGTDKLNHKNAEGKKRVYGYLHGWLSGPDSYKGRKLKEYLANLGVDLKLLDLKGDEGYAGIRYSKSLDIVADLYKQAGEGTSLVLFGSSLGGYVASRYAELHPEQVEKLVLFCPGFDVHSRWPNMLYGEDALQEWETKGHRTFEVKGERVDIPYDFVSDAMSHPPFPVYHCPALLIHGLKDKVVPVPTIFEAMERSATVRDKTMVYVVDDDHGLEQDPTLATAFGAIADFLDVRIPGAATPAAADRIEVEQKYPLTSRASLEEKITERGGKFKGTVRMTDVYWDKAPSYVLSRANAWVRQRAGIWELKVPAVTGERPNTMATACYREITGEADIAAWFNAHLPQHFRPLRAGESLETFLKSQGFGALAKYVTTRSKWGLEGGFVLDMDETDFGYSLVEVELLADAKDDLAEASRRIDELAQSLGLQSPSPAAGAVPYRGKLEEYIRVRNAELHGLLAQDGIFSPL